MSMLILFAFLPFFIMLLLWPRRVGGWRNAFVVAAIVWGASAVAMTEILSVFNAITPHAVAGGWMVVAALVIALTKFVPRIAEAAAPTPEPAPAEAWILLPQVFLLAAFLALVAWMGPPNNYDSMVYHMPRVIHWMQNRNVAFYPCSSGRQVEMTPGAEFLILHLQMLGNSDRWADMVQWFAYVGCIIGVSLAARSLGAGKRGQVLACTVMATLPMACFQAETTQNDLVGTFWLICFIVLVLRISRAPRRAAHWPLFILCGLALSLALVTKSTQYVYTAPFCVGLIVIALVRFKLRALAPLAALTAIAVSLSVPTFARNYRFTHTLLGRGGYGPIGGSYSNEHPGVGTTTSNILRCLALEFCTPPQESQIAVGKAVATIHGWLHLDINDPGSNLGGVFDPSTVTWNYEDQVPSPIQTLLAAAALITLPLALRRGSGPATLYALGVLAAFIGFCAYLRWQPWHCRLLLPLLIASSVFIGIAMEKYWKQPISLAITALLPLLVMPFLIADLSHPLGKGISIFDYPRENRYFLERGLLPQYRKIIDAAQAHHVRQVTYIGDGNTWEYPLQIMLRYRIPDVRVEPYPDVNTWSAELLHTRNKGFDPNLKPYLVVKIQGETATVVNFVDDH